MRFFSVRRRERTSELKLTRRPLPRSINRIKRQKRDEKTSVNTERRQASEAPSMYSPAAPLMFASDARRGRDGDGICVVAMQHVEVKRQRLCVCQKEDAARFC